MKKSMSSTSLEEVLECDPTIMETSQLVDYMKILINSAGDEFRDIHTRLLAGEEIPSSDVRYLLEAFAIIMCSTAFSKFMSSEYSIDNPIHFYHDLLDISSQLLDP